VQRIGTVTYRDYGIYAQSTYSILDNLKFTAGLRYTDDIMRDGVTRYEYFFPKPNDPVRTCELPLPPGNCFVANHTSSRAPTWVFDLDYTPIEDLMAYVKYARGYRQGGVLSTGPIGFETYQPEQVDTYEIGVKSSFRGTVPGYVNAAAFYNDFSDMQILGQFVNTHNQAIPLNAGILNAGSSRICGFELESSVTPYTGLNLNLAYTYLNSRLNSANQQNLTGGVYDHFAPSSIPGSPLQYSPRNKVSFQVTYKLPVDESLGKISIGATDVYTGSQLVQTGGPYTYLPSYNLLNFNLNWESISGGPFDAEFFMTNVTDEVYYTYLDDFTYFAGFASRVLGEPRMFGGRLRVHF
jgi:iron complex outermembrane receptor protein